jgi:hypothetical protein
LDPQRGVKIFIAGVLLNIARFVIPAIIGYYIDHTFIDQFMIEENKGDFLILLTFQVDILLFAGIAYMLIVYILRLDVQKFPVIIFFVVAIVSPFLWGINSGFFVIDILLQMLWGTSEYVFFPLFPWLCFPLLGAWICDYFQILNGSELEHLTGKKIGLVGGFLFVLGVIISGFDIEFHIGDYYRSGPGAIFLYSGFILIWILILKKTIHKINERFKRLMIFISKNLTSIYCIHWTILGWLLLVIPMYSLSGGLTLLLFMVIFPVSTVLSNYIRIKL